MKIRLIEVYSTFQAEANREGGAYNVGPSCVSVATSLEHVDGVRFATANGVGEELGDEREEELSCP